MFSFALVQSETPYVTLSFINVGKLVSIHLFVAAARPASVGLTPLVPPTLSVATSWPAPSALAAARPAPVG